MRPFVSVEFHRLARCPSLEAAIHRWVARLEWMALDVRRADVHLEPAGRRRTAALVEVAVAAGHAAPVRAAHGDAFVAVGDAFRAVHRQLLAPPARPPRPALAR